MFRKFLVYGAFSILLPITGVNAMLGCDYKTLNRKVDAYVMAVEAKQPIAEAVLQRDLQFLSTDATKDKSFSEFIDSQKFEELYARKITSPQVSGLADLCRSIFTCSLDDLKKAQAFILLKRVILMLEILKNTGMTFVPTVFD